MKKNNAGFSLVELMVVVAIIGILATIAIPNFNKFQNRSRQSNAKSELSNIFIAEKAFYAEYSIYSSNLPYIGFVPEGFATACSGTTASQRYYNVGFTGTPTWPAVGASPGLPSTAPAIACGTAGSGVTYFPANGTLTTAAAPSVGTAMATPWATFVSGATATLSGGTDTWTIDNNKTMSNLSSGL